MVFFGQAGHGFTFQKDMGGYRIDTLDTGKWLGNSEVFPPMFYNGIMFTEFLLSFLRAGLS